MPSGSSVHLHHPAYSLVVEKLKTLSDCAATQLNHIIRDTQSKTYRYTAKCVMLLKTNPPLHPPYANASSA